MATAAHDPMEDVERRRAELEENVTKLRQALKHWQTWELEYEMLKEEIETAPSSSPAQMTEIGRELGGRLLNEKEVQDLVGKGRTANQVIDVISRRIDYVQQNISTAAKQLDSLEKKLAGASLLLEPEMENEEGLQFMDIQEELDEEGNVVSSSVLQPGKSAPEIVEALRKAGVEKMEQDQKKAAKPNPEPLPSAVPATSTNASAPVKETVAAAPAESTATISSAAPPKKSVSFSEDTKPDPTEKKLAGFEATGYNEDLADYNFTRGTKVIEVDDNDNEIASYPIIPQGESPEDAALRRQMLQYGLSEVGSVVAEIDLDGRDDGYSDEDMDAEYDDDYDSDEAEGETEDKYGRSLKREVTDDYRQQMLELEQKLNARMVENVGPRSDEFPLAEYSDDIRTLKIRKDDSFQDGDDTSAESAPKKKGVRFADGLDISPANQPSKAPAVNLAPTATSTTTISDTIVERVGPAPQPPSVEPPKPAKVSRFKSSRATSGPPAKMLPSIHLPEAQPFPQGPQGETIASTIVERDTHAAAVITPDEFDPATINREIQTQYHKMRNKMIQDQGGFKPTEEDLDAPLLERVDGKVRKVSRFRAARLKADGEED